MKGMFFKDSGNAYEIISEPMRDERTSVDVVVKNLKNNEVSIFDVRNIKVIETDKDRVTEKEE